MVILHPPSEKQLEAMLSQLGETEDKLRHNISLLRSWLQTQPHLPRDCDDRMLGLFLRGCKQDVSRACRKLESFYCGRAACPDLFSSWDPADEPTTTAASLIEISILPRLTEDGHRLTVHRFRPHNDSSFVLRDIARLMLMMGELRLNMETVLSGDIYIFDMKNIVWAHWARLASPLLRRALSVVQDGYPQRLKQLHVVNAPPFVHTIVNLFKSLMKEKMRDRFIIHKDIESLHDYIDPSILPAEYLGEGGKLTEISNDWSQALISARNELRSASMKLVARRAKYTQKTQHNLKQDYQEDCQGTFRSLDID